MPTIYNIRRRNAMDLAERIGGQTRFADRLAMKNRQQASHIIGRTKRKNIGDDLARRIEVAFDKPLGWLDTDHDGVKPETPDPDFLVVPLLDHTVRRVVARSIELSREWIRQNVSATAFDHLAIATQDGDAMSPTVEPGSIILVDRGVTKVSDPDVYVVLVGESIQTRRLQPRLDGGILVLCDNPRYAQEVVPERERAKLMIVGRVLSAFTPQKV